MADTPRIEAAETASTFVKSQGGRLYVWLSDSGLEHETTKPKEGVDFDVITGQGFTLHVDRRIERPEFWRLVFHRFPRPHIRALWNGAAWSPGSQQTPHWEGRL